METIIRQTLEHKYLKNEHELLSNIIATNTNVFYKFGTGFVELSQIVMR